MAKKEKIKRFVFFLHSVRNGDEESRWEAAVAEARTKHKVLKKIRMWLRRRGEDCNALGCEHTHLIKETPPPVFVRQGITKNIKKI